MKRHILGVSILDFTENRHAIGEPAIHYGTVVYKEFSNSLSLFPSLNYRNFVRAGESEN